MTTEPKKIFVLEDEPLIAFEMTDTLEDLGFEVVGPSMHLNAGKDMAESADIDLAVLDVNLGNGRTSKPVAEILRERNIPFVFVTAYSKDAIPFADEVDPVVRKPFDTKLLAKALDEAAKRES